MTEPIQLVEQHHIKSSDTRFGVIDKATFASKNLYNKANYIIRQEFINNGRWIRYNQLAKELKTSDEFKALPAKVSQQVLKQLDKSWKSFFAAIKAWKATPEKFFSRPKLPHYKHKTDGRFMLIYTEQAISKPALQNGIIKPSQLGIAIQTKQSEVNQVRIVPRKGHYVVEVIYTVRPEVNHNLDANLVAGIDIGLSNLATVTSNKQGFQPFIINGKPLKSINQFYNKHKAELQSQSPNRTTKRMRDLTNKRNRKVKYYLHVASRQIIDYLVSEGIGVLVIGRNKNWKQEINIGKVNNQNFVSIPFGQFVQMLEYKAKLVGVQVILQEESYTSKCSFLDDEPIKKHKQYQGKRVKRGLFRASDGQLINADVNGSLNITKKAVPKAFTGERDRGYVVYPLRVTLHK